MLAPDISAADAAVHKIDSVPLLTELTSEND